MSMSSAFTPPNRTQWPTSTALPGTECRVELTNVKDNRSDPQAMGALGSKTVRADAAAWVRSGIESLGRDSRIRFVSAPADAQLQLSVELLKSYVMSVTSETRSVNVVLRVSYSRSGGPPFERIYRGNVDATIWIDPQSETQSSFDDALAQVLEAVDRDALALCAKQNLPQP
jgi:hypothetical protein